MKVLGIDPGIERLGWGLIEKNAEGFKYIDSGVKKTLKGKKTEERLLEIYNFLDKLFSNEKPKRVGVEKIFFSKNAKTAILIGEVRGVILMLAAKHRISVKEFAPVEIKSAFTGYGRADKNSVASMLKILKLLPPKKVLDDESDALALAFLTASFRDDL